MLISIKQFKQYSKLEIGKAVNISKNEMQNFTEIYIYFSLSEYQHNYQPVLQTLFPDN